VPSGTLPFGRVQPGTADAVLRKLYPETSPYGDNPIKWVREVLKEHLWSKQRAICRSVVKNRYTAVPSCHDSGKSFIASRICAWWISVHPPGDAFIVTTAPTTHQVDSILWREIGRAHRIGKLEGRITLDSKWRLGPAFGEELIGYGRKPADYNPEAFQGIHQKYVLVVIDEANGVPKSMFDAVDTIVTNSYARVLAIGNPDTPTSQFAKVCRRGSGWNVIHIDGLKTPNFTDEPVPDKLRDLLLSQEWVEERRKRWGTQSPMYESKVRGRFPLKSDDALIQKEWWDAACARDLDPEGYIGQYGFDVARYGEDSSVGFRNRGGHLRRTHTWHKEDTMESANRIQKVLVAHPGVPASVDGTGVGAGVVDRLKELGFDIYDYVSASAPSDDRFYNLRSESYWHLREMFEFGLIDVDENDEELEAQLTTLKWAINRSGKIQVESKEDYIKRNGSKSPDAADGANMACWDGPMYDAEMLNHADVEAITSDLLEVVW